MALVIPTSHSTFADATSVPGGPLSPYVLAQLPGDTELGWLSEIRNIAAVDELKWKGFQARRERLQAKPDLWRMITDSMRTATIVVIKPADVTRDIEQFLDEEHAEEGYDYNRQGIISACSVMLIADTPVAYLPNRLSETLGLYSQDLFLSFDKFAPKELLRRVGGGLRDAKIFAARAHAVFDARHLGPSNDRTTDSLGTSRMPILQELVATQRHFDHEHPRSAAVLNEASDTITGALESALLLPGEVSDMPLVQEYSSRDFDHLQAADIAAGWAHELIALSDERSLLSRFGRVIINGRRLR